MTQIDKADLINGLEKLQQLRASGVLTDDEFKKLKSDLIENNLNQNFSAFLFEIYLKLE